MDMFSKYLGAKATRLSAMLAPSLGLLVLAACGPRRAPQGALAASTSKSGLVTSRAPGSDLPAEPRIPPPCTTLTASKTANKGALAEADESKLDTDRIQSAIDACAYGKSVRLTGEGAKNAFLSGPIKMAKGVTLWIDANTTLFASRNPRDYDVQGNSCGTDELDDSNGCKPLILVEKVSDVGIMGEGVIDGRGGEPMLGTTTTWWDVAQHAKVKNLRHSNPRLIDVKKSTNFTLYKTSIFNSPKFHVVINAQHYLVWGAKVITPSRPANSLGKPLTPHYARNTDGVDPSAATDGVIAYSQISVGDDQIAIKAGDQGATNGLVIAHNHFGAGHGMSIGSETNGGVSNVHVFDLSIDGDFEAGTSGASNANGIRIKSDPSRGGEVSDVTFTDVCMRGLANPILLTPHYSDEEGGSIPVYRRVLLKNVRSTKGSKSPFSPVVTLMGYDHENALDVTLDNVVVEGTAAASVKSEFADITLGPGPVNFVPAGQEVTVDNKIATHEPPNPCTGKFVPVGVP
jgi:polygalacturonase